MNIEVRSLMIEEHHQTIMDSPQYIVFIHFNISCFSLLFVSISLPYISLTVVNVKSENIVPIRRLLGLYFRCSSSLNSTASLHLVTLYTLSANDAIRISPPSPQHHQTRIFICLSTF
jgi:hypothetical protein